jgi:transcriptional regulatory protein LevR
MEFMIAKSFPDTINKKINSNIPKIAGSFLIMFVYVCVSLGNLNCIENRVRI